MSNLGNAAQDHVSTAPAPPGDGPATSDSTDGGAAAHGSPASTSVTAEPPTRRPSTLSEIGRLVAPGAPAEAIGLALALLVAVVGQQLLGQRPLVVPVLGACAVMLLVVRLLTRPRRPPPPRRPARAPAAHAVAPAEDGLDARAADALGISALPAATSLPGRPSAPATRIDLPSGRGAAGGAEGAPADARGRTAAPAVEGVAPRGAGAGEAAGRARGREVGRLLGASPREWLLRAALLLAALVWLQMRGRPASADYTLVVALWLASLGAAAAAAPWPLPAPRRWLDALAAWPRTDWLLLGGVALGALLLRVVWLNHVPYVFGGDEGALALAAEDVLRGQLRNPFGTGWAALPTLFVFLQAGAMALVGETVAGARLPSALLGLLAVVFTYLLARRLFGRTVALTAAALLAVYHYHILYSRVAVPSIGDALLVVAALYFLDRAVAERRPPDALAAGVVIGLGAYASPVAGRVLPLLGVAYVLYAALWDGACARPRLPRGADWRALGPLVGWLVLGAALVALPLLAHYADFPAERTGRAEQASIFESGWLAREQQATGQSAAGLALAHGQRAALLPLTATPGGWYMGLTPTVGGLPALLPAVGLALVTLGAWRRRYFGLAVAYWGTALALGLTDDPAQPQHAVIMTAVVALITALGLCAPLRFAAWLGDLPHTVTSAVIAVVLFAIGLWNFQMVFRNSDPAAYYGTENGLVATELAYYLREQGPGTTVYLFGAPRIFYKSFPSVAFIAPEASGADVERPLAAGAAPLPLKGTTVFAFLPERVGELGQVRRWYPNGVAAEVRSPQGAPVLTLYRVVAP